MKKVVKRKKNTLGETHKDKLGVIGAVGAFLFPPVGLIIWAVNRDDAPSKAKAAITISGVSISLAILGRMLYNRQDKNKDNG